MLRAQMVSGDVVPAMPPYWTSSTVGYIGYSSHGTLDVWYLECKEAYLGFNPGSDGTVTVSGYGYQTAWWLQNGLYVGKGGSGTLNVIGSGDEKSGGVGSYTGVLGADSGSTGTVTLTGKRAQWYNYDKLTVGSSGTGTLKIHEGAKLFNYGNCYLAAETNSAGTATITDAGSTLTVDNKDLYIGNSGNGTLNIQAGGQVSNNNGYLGYNANSSGTVIVKGSGSKWTNSAGIVIGKGGEGTLTIEDGGQVSSLGSTIGGDAGSKGTVTLSGQASKWFPGGPSVIGFAGNGTFNILSGAQYGAEGYGTCTMAFQAGSSSTLTVADIGSKFAVDTLYVNRAGSGTLNIGEGKKLGGIVAVKTLALGTNGGGGGGSAVCNLNNAGTLQAGVISGRTGQTINWNDGTIRNYNNISSLTIDVGLNLKLSANGNHTFFIDSSSPSSIKSAISDATSNGSLNKAGGGILDLAAANTYSGPTTVEAGTLRISGSILNTSGITVAPSAILELSKSNSIPVNAAINNAGTLSVYNSLTVGDISGTGVTKVNSNATLTASSIQQDSLIIGGSSVTMIGNVTPSDPAAWTSSTDGFIGQSSTGEMIVSTRAVVANKNCYVGYESGSVGTLTVLSGGTSWISNTGLYVGYAGSATLNVGYGGVLSARSLRLANDNSGVGTVVIKSGGTLRAETISQGNGVGNFLWNDGTIQNYSVGSGLTIAGNMAVKLADTGTHAFNIDSNRRATIDAVLRDMTSNGSLKKIGAGALILTGSNTYSGGTTIEEGLFKVTGSVLNTSGVDVEAGATLELAKATGSATAANLAIENDGTVLISAGSQTVGTINGTGITQVNSGTTLTATSIIQDSLFIGTAGVGTANMAEVSTTNQVPEPGALTILVTGVLGTIGFVRRRKK